MSDPKSMSIEDVEVGLDAIMAAPDAELARRAPEIADDLLAMGEAVLLAWLASRDVEPVAGDIEGFRLLSLHRQGARGNPSFNACRETCREIVFHRNLILHDPAAADIARTVRLGAMVVRHLALFIGGKLQEAGLGEFCCSSRPLRRTETSNPVAETVQSRKRRLLCLSYVAVIFRTIFFTMSTTTSGIATGATEPTTSA